MVTIQPFRKTLNYSVPVLSFTSFIVGLLPFFLLLFDSVFDNSVYFSVLILELYSRYFDLVTPYT